MISTALLVENLSLGRTEKITPEVEELYLQRVIDTRSCTLCDADLGQPCRTNGGPPDLRRTHVVRLKLGRSDRAAALAWALAEAAQRAGVVDTQSA